MVEGGPNSLRISEDAIHKLLKELAYVGSMAGSLCPDARMRTLLQTTMAASMGELVANLTTKEAPSIRSLDACQMRKLGESMAVPLKWMDVTHANISNGSLIGNLIGQTNSTSTLEFAAANICINAATGSSEQQLLPSPMKRPRIDNTSPLKSAPNTIATDNPNFKPIKSNPIAASIEPARHSANIIHRKKSPSPKRVPARITPTRGTPTRGTPVPTLPSPLHPTADPYRTPTTPPAKQPSKSNPLTAMFRKSIPRKVDTLDASPTTVMQPPAPRTPAINAPSPANSIDSIAEGSVPRRSPTIALQQQAASLDYVSPGSTNAPPLPLGSAAKTPVTDDDVSAILQKVTFDRGPPMDAELAQIPEKIVRMTSTPTLPSAPSPSVSEGGAVDNADFEKYMEEVNALIEEENVSITPDAERKRRIDELHVKIERHEKNVQKRAERQLANATPEHSQTHTENHPTGIPMNNVLAKASEIPKSPLRMGTSTLELSMEVLDRAVMGAQNQQHNLKSVRGSGSGSTKAKGARK